MKKILPVLLAAAMVIAVLVSCKGGGKNPSGTAGDSSDTCPRPDSGSLTIEESSAVITNGKSEIRLSVEDSNLYITSLTLGGGKNRMAEKSQFSLPAGYYDGMVPDSYEWEFVQTERLEGTDCGVGYRGVIFRFRYESVIADVACRYYPGLDGPFEFFTSVTNNGEYDEEVCPNTFASFSFAKGGSDRVFYVAKESGVGEGFTEKTGRYYDGTGIYDFELTSGTSHNIWVSTFQSWNSSGYLPMAYITSDNSCGVYTALEWSSGRVLVEGKDSENSVRIDMDEVSKAPGAFHTAINPGGTLVLPNVYLGVYDGDVDDGSNAFKKWYFACKSPVSMRENAQEPLSQISQWVLENTRGVEAIKWDYGWWSTEKCGNWRNYEGSWVLRDPGQRNLLNFLKCEDLGDFGALAHEKGLKWTVYALLHDTLSSLDTPSTEFGPFNSADHPEWFSNRVVAKGMGASADLGNTEVVAYLQTAMAEFLTKSNIDTWRSDFEPIAYWSDKENRHHANGTDVQYWNTVGFGELVSYLIENVDGFRYESCSSGGSMKDLFTAKYASVFNCDDMANYLSLRMSFYDSSFVLHPAQLQSPCVLEYANPVNSRFWPEPDKGSLSDTEYHDAMLEMECRSQIMCAPAFCSSTNDEAEVEYFYGLLEKYTDIYANKVRPLLRDGDLYHILPRPDGTNWDGMMYADADSENEIKGVIFIFKPSAQAGDSVSFKLRGLYADVTYNLSFDDHPGLNVTASGSSLMSEGITVTIADCIGSDMIWITESR